MMTTALGIIAASTIMSTSLFRCVTDTLKDASDLIRKIMS